MKTTLNLDFPHRSLEGRLDFYKTLVKFVAGVLEASREGLGVNDKLSAIAFDSKGLKRDERMQFSTRATSAGSFAGF